jgi:hypothetical protein
MVELKIAFRSPVITDRPLEEAVMKRHKGFFQNEAKWIVWFAVAPLLIGLLTLFLLRFIR